VLCAPDLAAQVKPTQPIVIEGLEAYRLNGADSALSVWVAGWAQADSGSRNALRESLRQVEAASGRFVGHDIVATAEAGSGFSRVFVVMRYESRPLFARFDVYRPESDWKLVAITWHTNANEVWPTELLLPRTR